LGVLSILAMSREASSAAQGSEHALLSVNGHPWTIHKSGVAVHVPKDRPSVLRVCVLGDAASRCFGTLEKQENALSSQHTAGCEVLTSDCTCFRWMYSSDLTNTPSKVKASVSTRMPSCSIVTYTPQTTAQQKLTSVNLVFELDHFRPVIPRGYMWHLKKMYEHKIRTTNATQRSLHFSTFYYANRDALCNAKAGNEGTLPIAYGCRRTHLLGLYAADFGAARQSTPSFIEPLLWGLHLLVFAIIWNTRKNKHKQP
jgi:hypothetical protein